MINDGILKFYIQDHEVLIDAQFVQLLIDYKWRLYQNHYNDGSLGKYYIRAWDKKLKKRIFLHRAILGIDDPSTIIDHINHDPLDNRLSNLRICSCAENISNRKAPKSNTSGFKGVSKSGSKWIASITSKGKRFHLGTFENKYDAAQAYNKAALKHHKEYASLNIIGRSNER